MPTRARPALGAGRDNERETGRAPPRAPPPAEEKIEPRHHASTEGQDVRVQEAPREAVIREGDRYDAREAEDDSDGHPSVQALAKDVMREEADQERMGRHEDDG